MGSTGQTSRASSRSQHFMRPLLLDKADLTVRPERAEVRNLPTRAAAHLEAVILSRDVQFRACLQRRSLLHGTPGARLAAICYELLETQPFTSATKRVRANACRLAADAARQWKRI